MKRKTKRKSGSSTLAEKTGARQGGRTRPPCALAAGTAICCLLALLFTGNLAAKKKKPLTKTVQGEVLDKDNNPIVGASVELTDLTTGKTLGVYSEGDGRYQFTDLKPSDDYQVRAAYKGQQSDSRHVSSLDEESVKVLNLSIPPAISQ